MDKLTHGRPDGGTVKRALKSAGLALLFAALPCLPGALADSGAAAFAVVDSPASAAAFAPDESAGPLEKGNTQRLGQAEQTPVQAKPKAERQPEPPVGYRLCCFGSDAAYTCDMLAEDVTNTMQGYGDIVSYEVIGQSVQGRDIYALKVGSGETHVLITAGVHARENANTPMIMQGLFDFLGGAGDAQRDLLSKVTLVVVPLVNPDGYQYCLDTGESCKKTNINDVDLNRNFPCKYWNWGSRVKTGGNGYPGPYAASEPETQAVMALFDRYAFELAVDIHSRAREIICQKGGYKRRDISTGENPKALNKTSLALARYLRKQIKYRLVKETKVVRGEEGTLTDYAFTHGVPTVTFETLRYYKCRLASPEEIRREYAYFDWPRTLSRICDFAAGL